MKQKKVNQKYRYFDLIRELAVTDFKLKYQGSVAGYLWSLAKPLMIFGVLYIVFSVFVKIGSSIPHYPLYLLLGVILWSYFAEATSIGMRSIVEKGDMIRKVYFPRSVLIISASISSFITLLLNLIVVFIFIAFLRLSIQPVSIILFLLLLVELYVLVLGVSLFLSSWYVKYRDVGHIWEVLTQVMFYATPIIYPLAIVPSKFQKLIVLNPITQIIQDSRWLLISKDTATTHSLLGLPVSMLVTISPFVLAFFGYKLFKRSAYRFAEEV